MDPANDLGFWKQYGPLGVAVFVFACVIAYLFKLLMNKSTRDEKRAEDNAKERAGWDVERERLRAEYEERHRELIDGYAKDLLAERNSNRAHEDLVRKEFTDLMERLSDDNVKSSEQVVSVLQKFHDRFVGPTSRRSR